MATITLTEILGGDNIAGSRLTINDNFKRVSNAINTLETRLDTSYTPGGALNVGNAIIKKYTNAATQQIFTCEATGLFQGNLNVSLGLGVTQSIAAGLDLNVSRNITFDGAATGGGSFTSNVSSTFSRAIVNQQLYNSVAAAATLNPQSLAGSPATARSITTSLKNHSVLRINLGSYAPVATPANNCNEIVLPPVGGALVTNGQTLTVIIDTVAAEAMNAGFKISATNLATADPIVFGGSTTINPNAAGIKKLAITLFADTAGWRVLSSSNVFVTGTPALTY